MASEKTDKPNKPEGEKAEKKAKPEGKRRAEKSESRQEATGPVTSTAEIEAPRFALRYTKEIIPALTKEFNFKNPNQVPRLQKIVVNMGLGAAVSNPKIIDAAVDEMRAITGQKPVVTRAKKAIATFKLREGVPIGAMVTLRQGRMWEFLDRLLSVSLPRIRDFRGLSPRQFDGRGNYTFGLNEQAMFAEINQDSIDRVRGMDITVVTTAKNDDEGRALLKALGFPFQAK